MAQPRSPRESPTNHRFEEPNHMIIWLDATIGDPAEYIHLKKAFASNTDPRAQTWIMLKDKDYVHIIEENSAVSVQFEGVKFLFQAFNNEDDCLKAFEENQDKRIFFITSGPMGKKIVPRIIERYPRIFTDLITDEPYPSIYVFCHNIANNMGWAMDYIGYIQMFNFDSELLERLTRDIAEYFIERSKRLHKDGKLKDARRRLHWAKKLWHQYDKMQQPIGTDDLQPVRETSEMRQINEKIKKIESELPARSPNNSDSSSDDDRCGQPS